MNKFEQAMEDLLSANPELKQWYDNIMNDLKREQALWREIEEMQSNATATKETDAPTTKAKWTIVPAHGTVKEYELADSEDEEIRTILKKLQESGRYFLSSGGFGYFIVHGKLARRKY